MRRLTTTTLTLTSRFACFHAQSKLRDELIPDDEKLLVEAAWRDPRIYQPGEWPCAIAASLQPCLEVIVTCRSLMS